MVIGIDPDATVEFVFPQDLDEDGNRKPGATVFKLGQPSYGTWKRVTNRLGNLVSMLGVGGNNTPPPMGEIALELIAEGGLRGWENFKVRGPDGQLKDAVFVRDEKGRMTEASVMQLTSQQRLTLLEKIYWLVPPTEDEMGKSASPPASGGGS